MKPATKWVLILLGAAAAASAAAIVLRGGAVHGSAVARILQDGVLVEEIPLDQVETGYTFVVESGGGSNTIQVEKGRIRVCEADCPDQVCVKQGYISDAARPIVCLPHKLVIEIVGGGETLDAAAG